MVSLLANIRPARKNSPGANVLAYFSSISDEEKKWWTSYQLGTPHMATIMILDDDHGGVFQVSILKKTFFLFAVDTQCFRGSTLR